MIDLDAFLDPARVSEEVPSGAAFDAWRLKALAPEELAALGDGSDHLGEAQLIYLAWLDLLAPSTHNTVPQRIRIDATHGAIELLIDRRRVLPESDPSGRQALVSLGAGIANVELGAASLGFTTRLEILPIPAERLRPWVSGEPELETVARLTFTPAAAPVRPSWIPSMLTRKVVRAEFDDRVALDADLAETLATIAARHAGLELHVISDAASRLFLGKFQELADTTVVNRDRFAIELAAWLHEDDTDVPVGMRGREFGLSAEATRRMRDGLSRRAALLPDEIAAFAKVGNVGMRSSAAVAVITVESDDTAGRIAAGRAYEEMTLLLERRGFVTAMHAGITEVDAPNFALRGRLRTRRRPIVVFRIGRALRAEDAARPHAARPHLRDVLV